jgi:hypothetical protein
MKNTISKIVGLTLSFIFLFSCSKEDGSSSSGNTSNPNVKRKQYLSMNLNGRNFRTDSSVFAGYSQFTKVININELYNSDTISFGFYIDSATTPVGTFTNKNKITLRIQLRNSYSYSTKLYSFGKTSTKGRFTLNVLEYNDNSSSVNFGDIRATFFGVIYNSTNLNDSIIITNGVLDYF